jgi:hypothetical protein
MSSQVNSARDHMIVAKFLAGRSRKEIADWAGIHCGTVSHILKRNNMGRKRRAEIKAESEANLYPGSVWIKGYEGHYRIFDDGRVMSFNYMKPVFLKPLLHKKNGRLSVWLSNGRKDIKKIPIHALVAKHFVPGYKPGLQVNHKNCIKTDNRAENLEWVTSLENMRHAFANGLVKKRGKGKKTIARMEKLK